jgi:hypothetical protein
MNLKQTIILLVAAVLLLGYIAWFEREDSDGTGAPAELMFPVVQSSGVDQIEVVRSNEVIRAERVGGRWRMGDARYPARQPAIENWLEALSGATRRVTLTAADLAEQGVDLAAFGLEPPEVKVKVRQSGEELQFRLGYRTPVGERVYLQMEGTGEVHVAESGLLDLLPRSTGDWRDRDFVDLSGVGFNRLRVKAGERGFEVEYVGDPDRWQFIRPRRARADAGRIGTALQALHGMRVERFVQDDPGADLEPYGLDEPALVLSFHEGTNDLFAVQFGSGSEAEPGLVYARRSDYPNVVLVSREPVETWSGAYTEFLDYRLVDRPLDGVQRVEARGVESFTLARQAEGGWRVTAPREFVADPALVAGFLGRLQTMKIAEVAKEVVTELDLPNYGLATPSLQYELLVGPVKEGGEPERLMQIEFGTNRADRVYVRRSDENPVYMTLVEETVFLPRAAFELRDRRLWEFETNQVESVTIKLGGREHKLLRSAGGQWVFAAGSQGIVNTFALEEAVYRFGQLWARAWVAQEPVDLEFYGFPQVDHRLAVKLLSTAGGRELEVAFGARSPSGGPFGLMELEGCATVFQVPYEVYYAYEEVVRSLVPGLGAGQ